MIRICSKGKRLKGFAMIEGIAPEYPEVYMFVNMTMRAILINKSAREGANVVKLIF